MDRIKRMGTVFLAALMMLLVSTPMLLQSAIRHDEGSITTFTFPGWLSVPSLAGSGVAMLILYLNRARVGMKLGLALIVLGLGIPLFQVPGLVYDYVLVDDDGFRFREWTGQGFTQKSVRFQDLAKLRHIQTVYLQSKAQTSALVSVPRVGPPITFDSKDVLKSAAIPEILLRAGRKKTPLDIERRIQND